MTDHNCRSYCLDCLPRTPREQKWVIITRHAGVDFTSEPLSARVLADTTYQMQEAGIRYRTARA